MVVRSCSPPAQGSEPVGASSPEGWPKDVFAGGRAGRVADGGGLEKSTEAPAPAAHATSLNSENGPMTCIVTRTATTAPCPTSTTRSDRYRCPRDSHGTDRRCCSATAAPCLQTTGPKVISGRLRQEPVDEKSLGGGRGRRGCCTSVLYAPCRIRSGFSDLPLAVSQAVKPTRVSRRPSVSGVLSG